MKEILIVIAVCTVLVAAVLAGATLLDRYACLTRWEASGMQVDWGLVRGCRVRMPSGAWIPEDRVREINTQEPTK